MDSLAPEIEANRKTEYPIHPLILNRWSPRAMTGEELSDAELMPLFEAARWAPSSRNNQSWRFVYAKRGTPHWETFFNLLVPGNQTWTKNAAVLIAVLSKKTFDKDGQPSKTHSFDAGAAFENLALEATFRGFVVHPMEGFDYDKTQKELGVPDEYSVEVMVAVGKSAPKESLPVDLQAREVPSSRRPLKEIVVEGKFKE